MAAISIPRVNQILQHELYEEYDRKNKLAEAKRVFCRHGSDHGLNVARIAYIYLLERGETSLSKEVIYAAGLLHDIGRWVEYETQEDHAQVGARLAPQILRDCGFSEQEVEVIVQGILEHRLKFSEEASILGQALLQADDWERDCKNCESKTLCYKYTKTMEEVII
jgi:uncharacterized protein